MLANQYFYIMLRKIFSILILTALINTVSAQQSDKKNKDASLIQLSGVVIEADSLNSVPYTSVIVRHTNRGTVSDYFGYFSFVAKKNDTLEFSAIGYSSAYFVVPDTLTANSYSLIQVLRSDTISLKPVEILPWPSKEHFKQAFLNLNITDQELLNVTKNMKRATAKAHMVDMAADAASSYKYSMQEYQSKLYYAGQYPPISLLNPIAWAKFIKAWKNGDYQKQ